MIKPLITFTALISVAEVCVASHLRRNLISRPSNAAGVFDSIARPVKMFFKSHKDVDTRQNEEEQLGGGDGEALEKTKNNQTQRPRKIKKKSLGPDIIL